MGLFAEVSGLGDQNPSCAATLACPRITISLVLSTNAEITGRVFREHRVWTRRDKRHPPRRGERTITYEKSYIRWEGLGAILQGNRHKTSSVKFPLRDWVLFGISWVSSFYLLSTCTWPLCVHKTGNERGSPTPRQRRKARAKVNFMIGIFPDTNFLRWRHGDTC